MKRKNYGSIILGIGLFIMLVIFAEEFRKGFTLGLRNCSDIVIPSLFPFLVAASLAGCGELPPKLSRIFSPVTKLLFGLPAESTFAIILGQLGGYLSGAKSAQSLCSSGIITARQAEKLLLFCINPGIGFAVNALGSIMLSSRGSGRIVFVSVCISSVICGIAARFINSESKAEDKTVKSVPPFSEAVVNSVSSGTFSVFIACAFVCFFSGLLSVIEACVSNENIKLAAICLMEITNSCIYASKELSLPFISALCAFGGLCVHMQIFAVADNFRIRIPVFYAFRFLHAVLSFGVCSFILWLFPCDVQVMVNVTPEAALWSFSAPASVSLLFLSALLILDLDNMYKIC